MVKLQLARWFLVGALAFSITAAGCSDSADSAVTPATATIGPAGGTLTLSDGASVTIPPGALTTDVEITLERATPPAGAAFPVASQGHTYRLLPHGTTFTSPVTLRLPVSDFNTPLTLYTLDDDSDTTWERIDGGTIEPNGGRILITHFSYVGWGVCDQLTMLCSICDPAGLCDYPTPDAGAGVDAGPPAICGDGFVTGDESCDTAISTPGDYGYCPPDNDYCVSLCTNPCTSCWIVQSGGACGDICVQANTCP